MGTCLPWQYKCRAEEAEGACKKEAAKAKAVEAAAEATRLHAETAPGERRHIKHTKK